MPKAAPDQGLPGPEVCVPSIHSARKQRLAGDEVPHRHLSSPLPAQGSRIPGPSRSELGFRLQGDGNSGNLLHSSSPNYKTSPDTEKRTLVRWNPVYPTPQAEVPSFLTES